jgi:hypothetical protein
LIFAPERRAFPKGSAMAPFGRYFLRDQPQFVIPRGNNR